MKYEVIMSFGNFKVGNILDSENKDHNKIIKRKLQEGGTLQALKESSVRENKMNKKTYENKEATN